MNGNDACLLLALHSAGILLESIFLKISCPMAKPSRPSALSAAPAVFTTHLQAVL